MKRLSAVALGFAATISLGAGWGCSSGSAGGGSGGSVGSGGTGSETGGSTGSGGAATGGGNGSGGTTGSGGAPGTGGGSGGTTVGTGGAASGGSGGKGGTTGSGGSGTGGAATGSGGAAGAGSGGAGGKAGASGSGGGGAGGATSGNGGAAGAGAGGAGGSSAVDCSSASGVITFPTLPGATMSPLYTVTANGASQFVEKLTKFSPEMQVHYAYFGVANGCTATVAVTVAQSFTSYTLSPKSKNIAVTKSGNTLTFSSGPNYLILQIPNQELLFVLIDAQESNPPKLGDANVKNLADYTVDNTGATLVTSKFQSAINAASGATQNILYVPAGKYKVGELSMKSNMTMYLAAGALLDASTSTGDYTAAGPMVENTTHGVVHFNNVSNSNLLGRGVIDGEGTKINNGSNDTPAFKINVLRIDQGTKITVDGILVRDPVFWNTLAYMSSQVTIQNYKVINRRPTTTTYNQTDGIDIDASNNCTVYNTFVYSGDDNLSPKTEQEANMNSSNITYQKSVLYSNSGGCKIGTKTFGTTSNPTMTGIVFNDIDIVKAGRALAIDANDTALISGTMFENIRVEAADSMLIDIEEDQAPTWRTAPNTSIAKDTYFTNVSSNVKQTIQLHGLNSTVNVNGVHFSNFTVAGKAVTSQTDTDASWDINQYVSNITFQ